MTTLEPVEPVIPVVRRPMRRGIHADAEPLVAPRKPILTLGNCILAVVLIAFGLYATGNLPQLDQAFDGLHASLQSHNDAVVRTTMHFGPLLLFGFVLLLVATFSALRFLVRPPQVSEDMDWHSRAVDERALKTSKSRPSREVATPATKVDANTFLRPLHKQSKLRPAASAPRPLTSIGRPASQESDT